MPEKEPPRDKIPVPHDLQIELHDDPEAAAAFAALPPSHQREWARVGGEARQAETRVERAAAAIPMIYEWGQRRSG